MTIEEEINQKKFRNVYHKSVINLLFTAMKIESHHSDFLNEFELTCQQYNVLRILRGKYPDKLSAKSIKDRMLDKNSDVSRLLSRLVMKKLVTKSPSSTDRRAFDVRITKIALELLSSIDEHIDEMDKQICHLSDKECLQLNGLLDKYRG